MHHYYKVPNTNGYQLEEHPQQMDVLAECEITEQQYGDAQTEIKQHTERVKRYTEQIKAEEIALDDVAEDCLLEVTAEVHRAEIVSYAKRVSSGEIKLEDTPEEYREEIKIMQAQDPEQALINEIIQEVKSDE